MTRCWLASLLICLSALTTAVASAEQEKRPRRETGKSRHGRVEISRAQASPAHRLRELDAATREEIERRWGRLLNKTSRDIPPLSFTVPGKPVPDGPRSPQTSFSLHTKAAAGFVFVKNTEPSAVAPFNSSAIVNEPALAAVGDRVFFTGNWYAASSIDGGNTFNYMNPSPGPFAAPATGSFCCDQVVTYDPGTNALFYLQQFFANVSTGIQRVNVDMGADGTFECAYDLTPQDFGFADFNWPDFPDLAVSDGHLYHSSNVFSGFGGGFTGAYVARFPLSEIGTCQAAPSFDAYMDTTFFSFKLSRGATSVMYFADHISNTSLRIWSWPASSAAPVSVDRTVSSWSDDTRVCPGPDARDWCGFIDRRMMAAYVADGIVGFMWTPAQDATFPFPYTRVAQFAESDLSLVGEPDLWSNEFALVYPSVAVNADGNLGGTVMLGGGMVFPTCSAWIADDDNGDILAPLEHHVALQGASGPSINRSGDYNSAQTYHPNTRLWAGGCFAYLSPNVGSSRYVLFGRERDASAAIFHDSFESGNTNAW